jgi:hypothetical protein
MQLILATHNPLDSTYHDATWRDADSGVVQYKVRTPIKMHDQTTTISRRIEGDIPQRDSSATDDSERFGLVAQISWHLVGSSVIQFGDKDIECAKFFRKESLGLYGQ